MIKPVRRLRTNRPSERYPADTVKTATADLACKKSTNLIGVWFTVEAAYQQRLIDQHEDLVNATKEARDARLRIADSLSKVSGD